MPCKNPIYMRELDANVPCRKCRVCLGAAVNFKAAQAVMEAQIADMAVAVTLTFSPDYEHYASHIDKTVFQDFIAALRSHGREHGFTVRYQVAGEYGTLKGRAHFHALLFFSGRNLPAFQYKERFDWPHWEYGHTFADHVNYETARYIAAYFNKDVVKKNALQMPWYSASKRPELGSAYYQKFADHCAKLLSVPNSRRFTVPEARLKSTVDGSRDGMKKAVQFAMPPHVLDKFFGYFIAAWQRRHGDKPIPERNEIFIKWLDAKARADRREGNRELITRLGAMNPHWTPNRLDRVTTFRLAATADYIIARTASGDYIARMFDHAGRALAERPLLSRGQIRKAIRGQLEFRPAEYFNAPVEPGAPTRPARPKRGDRPRFKERYL